MLKYFTNVSFIRYRTCLHFFLSIRVKVYLKLSYRFWKESYSHSKTFGMILCIFGSLYTGNLKNILRHRFFFFISCEIILSHSKLSRYGNHLDSTDCTVIALMLLPKIVLVILMKSLVRLKS